MVRRLLKGNHACVVNGQNSESIKALMAEGAIGAE